MNKIKIMLLSILTPFLLTGCWNMREIEHLFYVHSLGIDYTDNQYVVYAQVLNFETLAKKEGGGGSEQSGAWVGIGAGKTIESAIQNLYSSSQRRLYWGHLNSIVFSEALLKHGVENIGDLITRYNEVRLNVWVFSTRNSLKELLLTSPILENSPVYSLLSDPRDVYRQSSYIAPIRFNQFFSMLYEPGATPLIPNLKIRKDKWRDQKKSHPSIEIEGISVLKEGKWAGRFPKIDIPGLRWLDNQTSRTPCIIYLKGEPVAVLILENPRPKITPVLQAGKITFQTSLSISGSVIEMRKGLTEKYICEQAENTIKKEIYKTWEEGLKKDVDLFNLNEEAYRHFPREWHKLLKNGTLPLKENALVINHVKVNLLDSGRSNINIENPFND